MSTISNVHARQMFDSRGNPTIEVEVTTKDGIFRAAVPSGASTGIHEAHELRDNKKAYGGQGVLKAVKNVNTKIKKELIGKSVINQNLIDTRLNKLDGTKNKSNLGANAILGTSMAICKAGACAKKIPLYQHIANIAKNKKLLLPVPCMNIINGGKHAENKLDVQEFMIIPIGAKTFTQSMQMGSEVYHILKSIIKKKYGGESTSVGDEGGFAPNVKSTEEAIKLVESAISKAGYKGKIRIGLDAAASEFYENKKYVFEGKKQTADSLSKRYIELIKKYKLISVEDPFEQDDFAPCASLTKSAGKTCQIVGDDILVTSVERIHAAAAQKAVNALLLKVNQIGTVSEAIASANLAKKYKWNVMVSHRSGETEDTFIADLVVGLGVGQIKTGAPCRSERLAKYNQLLRIEESLGKKAKYAGKKAF